jgi:nucleoside-diphosphate-sugar epimerase
MRTQQLRVLVTGHTGYIGSVMAPLIRKAGHSVVGMDTGYFDRCKLFDGDDSIPMIQRDIREVERQDLEGFDAIVHLAALSNDPVGDLNERWTDEINHGGSVRLAQMAKAAGVRRLLFSSSCIMYGVSQLSVVTEESPLDPKTEYARSKVKAEQAISALASAKFSPTFLRNGTVYGPSPRMRFDTVLNNLVGAAVATGKVTVYGGGKPWRPVMHVEDVSRGFLQVLEAPVEQVHNQAFNLGADHLNQQVIQLAEITARTVPGAQLEVLNQAGADQRTYWTSFQKFAKTFPDFEFKWNAETGARDLYDTFQRLGLTQDDFNDKKFTRLKWLKHLMDTQQLDPALRWQSIAMQASPR